MAQNLALLNLGTDALEASAVDADLSQADYSLRDVTYIVEPSGRKIRKKKKKKKGKPSLPQIVEEDAEEKQQPNTLLTAEVLADVDHKKAQRPSEEN